MKGTVQVFVLVGIGFSIYVGVFMVRLAWTKSYPTGERIFMTLLALAEVWCFVSTWRWSVAFGKTNGFDAKQLLLGPRPADLVAERAWIWGRHFRYAFLTVLACMIVISFYVWKYG